MNGGVSIHGLLAGKLTTPPPQYGEITVSSA